MERERLLARAETGRTVGLLTVAAGLFASLPAVGWVGVACVVASMGVITGVRVRRLSEGPFTPTHRTRLAATWVLFVLSLSGLLVVAMPGERLPDEGRLLPALAVTTVATLVGYRLFRAAYLPEDWEFGAETDGEPDGEEQEGEPERDGEASTAEP